MTTQTGQGHFSSPAAIHSFALAGDARITFHSLASGNHYTYQITRAKPRGDQAEAPKLWFVEVLTDGDQWVYLGVLREITRALQFALTAKSKLTTDAPAVRAFMFGWRWIARGIIPAQLEVRHEGRCGRCNRALTHPDSLDLGIGPDCAEAMGISLTRRCEAVAA